MEVLRLGPGDDAQLADVEPCFDHPVQAAAASRFLSSDDHHIFVAYEGAEPAGFVTGVEMTHPDKGTEMFLYELEVREKFRNRGIGTALVGALAEHAKQRGCYGLWVLTDDDNHAALRVYAKAGGHRESMPVMLAWEF